MKGLSQRSGLHWIIYYLYIKVKSKTWLRRVMKIFPGKKSQILKGPIFNNFGFLIDITAKATIGS